MGETIRGGFYRTVDGKYRDANGVEVDKSEGQKWAAEREKAQLKQAEKETGKPVREIQAEAEDKHTAEPPVTEGAATKSDPSTLGPIVPPDPTQASKNAEKAAAQAGVPGGKRGSK